MSTPLGPGLLPFVTGYRGPAQERQPCKKGLKRGGGGQNKKKKRRRGEYRVPKNYHTFLYRTVLRRFCNFTG